MTVIDYIENKTASSNQMVDSVGKVFIIAYQESTRLLEETLTKEGFNCEVLRQESKPEYQHFSRSYLCLLNHLHAWEKALQSKKPTLIVEADFVPVVGFGELPLPFNQHQTDLGIAWLYTCAPQIYSVSSNGYAQGFSTSMVAYIVNSQVAKHLIAYTEEIRQKVGPNNYSAWDSGVDSFLLRRKLKNYIPFRNYGEHGGVPNPEHSQNGLSKTHRADILYGKLAFFPSYALDKGRKNRLKLLSVRLKARLKGIARLGIGRFLRWPIVRESSVPFRLIGFAVGRQLSLRL
ncbi:MAG: hypothetical protein WA919_01290 [Coleofasciculaceae cyanobacterium]